MAPPPPKVPLILAPTPLHKLHGASADLGLDLWMKRDDLTAFAMGGNKGRKLEFLIADAIAKNADVVVTCGSAQSNFIRQLGAACAMYGLGCAAATMALPYDSAAGKPARSHPEGGGNVVLDEILGVDLRMHDDDDWEVLYAEAEDLAREYEAKGKTVYRIPVGGSSGLGAYAFYMAAQELSGERFDCIVFPSSSGSTQTGLAYFFDGSETQILGMACDPEPEIAHDFVKIGEELAPLISAPRVLAFEDFQLNFDFVGEGYGIPSAEGRHALEYLARREGIFLDPIYTAKAFAGLMRLAETKAIEGRILFWHTGGTPALFA